MAEASVSPLTSQSRSAAPFGKVSSIFAVKGFARSAWWLKTAVCGNGSADKAQVALAENLGLLKQGETDEAAIDAALSQVDYQDPETGKALFNLEVAGGAYACARCHTRGWSIIPDSIEPPNADLSDYAGFPDGSGALGSAVFNVSGRLCGSTEGP